MSDPHRSISLQRRSKGVYEATNSHGDTLVVGESDGAFSAVELLLTALAACGAADVDYIVSKREEPSSLRLRVDANKVRDEGGNHLTDIVITFDATFTDSDAGQAARDVLPRAVQQSHDRLCTVSRTVQLGEPVDSVIAKID